MKTKKNRTRAIKVARPKPALDPLLAQEQKKLSELEGFLSPYGSIRLLYRRTNQVA